MTSLKLLYMTDEIFCNPIFRGRPHIPNEENWPISRKCVHTDYWIGTETGTWYVYKDQSERKKASNPYFVCLIRNGLRPFLVTHTTYNVFVCFVPRNLKNQSLWRVQCTNYLSYRGFDTTKVHFCRTRISIRQIVDFYLHSIDNPIYIDIGESGDHQKSTGWWGWLYLMSSKSSSCLSSKLDLLFAF